MSEYKKGQLVWAKIKGYPWWPGIVSKIILDDDDEDSYHVDFIGHNSYGIMASDKLADFKDKYKLYSGNKSRKLQESIKVAVRIQNGETSFENERDKLKKKPTKEKSPEPESEEESPVEIVKPKKDVKSKPVKKEEKKEKEKEKEKEKDSIKKKKPVKEESEAEQSDDALLFQRTTRAKARKSHIELFTDPIIFSNRRGRKSNSKKPQKNNKKKVESSDDDDDDRSSSKEIKDSKKSKSQSKDKDKEKEKEKGKKTPTPSKVNAKRKAPPKSKPKKKEKEDNNKGNSDDDADEKEKDEEISSIEDNESDEEKQEVNLSKTQKKVKTSSSSQDKTPKNVPPPAKKAETVNNKKPTKTESPLAKIESELKPVLENLAKKCKTKQNLKEDDADIDKLTNLTNDFDKHNFEGLELIKSTCGKLFKTIHHHLTVNKNLLNKKGLELITNLAKILHKIKDKILKHVLDNSEYLDDEEISRVQDSNNSLFAFEADPIKVKIEENENSQSKTLPIKKPNENGVEIKDNKNSQNVIRDDKKDSNLFLRKKACQKFARLLQANFSLDKDKAQELTLAVETQINEISNTYLDYKQAMRALLRSIKNHAVSLEEIKSFKELTVDQIKDFISMKISKSKSKDDQKKGKKNDKDESSDDE